MTMYKKYVVMFTLINPNQARLETSPLIEGKVGTSAPLMSVPVPVPSKEDIGNNFAILEVGDNMWTTRTIEQSTPLPCTDNTITVHLSTKVPLSILCTPKVTIAGLLRFTTASTALEIRPCMGESLSRTAEANLWVSESSGTWTNANGVGSLVVPYASTTVQDEIYCFEFTLKNPSWLFTLKNRTSARFTTLSADLASPTNSLSVNVPITDTDLSFKVLEDVTPELKDMNIVNARTDFKMGQVAESYFSYTRVWQTVPYPCMANAIHLEFLTAARLTSGTKLTVTGLISQTASGGVPHWGEHRNMFDAATWSATANTVVLTLTSDTNSSVVCKFNVNLTNIRSTLGVEHLGSDVTIQADKCLDPTVMLFRPDDVVPWLNTTIEASLNQHAKPNFLYTPQWIKKEISQSTPYPGSPNMITVSLQSNVPLSPLCGSGITISGLTDNSVRAEYSYVITRTRTISSDSSTDVWVDGIGDNVSLTHTGSTPYIEYDKTRPSFAVYGKFVDEFATETTGRPVARLSPEDGLLQLAPRTGACKLKSSGDDQMSFMSALTNGEIGAGIWEGNYITSEATGNNKNAWQKITTNAFPLHAAGHGWEPTTLSGHGRNRIMLSSNIYRPTTVPLQNWTRIALLIAKANLNATRAMSSIIRTLQARGFLFTPGRPPWPAKCTLSRLR
jgi:hypothetical protein